MILLTQGSAGANAPSSDATPYISTEIQNSIIDPLSRSQRSNVGVFYLHNTKVHSKLVMIDDEFVSIGSANAWDRSMEGDESELSVAILDPGGTRSLVADLRVKLWQEHHRLPDNQVTDTILRNLQIDSASSISPGASAAVTGPEHGRATHAARVAPDRRPDPAGWENWRRGDERTITNSIQARSQQNREDLTDAFARMGMDTRTTTNNFTLGRTDRADRATLDEGEAGQGYRRTQARRGTGFSTPAPPGARSSSDLPTYDAVPDYVERAQVEPGSYGAAEPLYWPLYDTEGAIVGMTFMQGQERERVQQWAASSTLERDRSVEVDTDYETVARMQPTERSQHMRTVLTPFNNKKTFVVDGHQDGDTLTVSYSDGHVEQWHGDRAAKFHHGDGGVQARDQSHDGRRCAAGAQQDRSGVHRVPCGPGGPSWQVPGRGLRNRATRAAGRGAARAFRHRQGCAHRP
ncbi:hypothetical protein [Kibdelosporangium philippinense]|uniref:hypothetical protein n=1 Tax=Kibdelosporangium philippinense TaxID=211113 RepID=UPI0036122272